MITKMVRATSNMWPKMTLFRRDTDPKMMDVLLIPKIPGRDSNELSGVG